jgi:hypothetical protein
MKIDKASFDKIYASKFWTKLKDSIVPFGKTPDKAKFLDELYEGITEFTYNPKNPREYIVTNKMFFRINSFERIYKRTIGC